MNKNNLMILLVFVVALMSVAFAALSTSLSITGTGTIDSIWGPIYIDSCSCSVVNSIDSSNKPTATCGPTSGGSNTTVTGTVTANMKLPGDKVTCTFYVKNGGTLHAGVPSLVSGPNNYFRVTSSATTIGAGGTGTLVVNVEYKAETSGSQTIAVTADYGQTATTISTTQPI